MTENTEYTGVQQDVEDLLIDVLSKVGYPVRRQGSLLENEPFPDDFFTFWNSSAENDSYYDDEETETIYEFDVNFYSNNPANVYKTLRNAAELLKNNGFEMYEKGHDVASGNQSHIGRGITVIYIQKER
jgi:hypothetical protein